MTDVTGFGLLGHLIEMADGSGLTAELHAAAVPRLPHVAHYLSEGCVPGGTHRNFESYGHKVSSLREEDKQLLCDPQTSGGLLVAVSPLEEAAFLQTASAAGLTLHPIGRLTARQTHAVRVL
jgi:selenide,water dikinase